jgi:hypothetical protein
MRKLLLIVFLSSSIFALESPTSSVSVGDMVDKQLPAMDKKIWQNLLQYYANVRMIALTTLKDMQAIANFAWSAERQLQAIENASKRIDQIYTDVQNFKGSNPVDYVIFTETHVFRQTDAFLYNDIPTITDRNRQLLADRNTIVNMGVDQAKALADAGVKAYTWFDAKFSNAQTRAQPNKNDYDPSCPRPGPAVATMSGTIVSQGLAGADLRNQQLQTQNAQLAAMAGATAGNNGDMPANACASISKDNNRNKLLMTLQENDLQNAAINNSAWYLILKARMIDNAIVSKAFLVTAATAFSEELQKSNPNARFVPRQ